MCLRTCLLPSISENEILDGNLYRNSIITYKFFAYRTRVTRSDTIANRCMIKGTVTFNAHFLHQTTHLIKNKHTNLLFLVYNIF